MSITKSLSWTFTSRIGAQFTSILFSVFLARLLTPAEYGLIAMVTVLSGFATIIAEAGLNAALVYLKDANDEAFSTAFWIQFTLNVFLTTLFFLSAGLIASFYQQPTLVPLTQLMSATFVLQSIGQIQMAILTRHLKFKAIAIASFASAFFSSLCALILALNGWGVWALAWQQIIQVLVLLLGTSLATRWYPRVHFSVGIARQIGSYSVYLLLHNGINYWLRNGDNLLIGRVLGGAPLGVYNRAYSLMLLPLQNIGAIVGQVMFPTLSKLRDDPVSFRDLYTRSIRLIALVAFPIMGGLSVLSEPIVLLLYGKQWAGSVPVLQILSLVGLFQCMIFPVGWVFTALGKTKEQFRITLALVFPFVVLIGFGMSYGLLGVTWGYAIWAIISGFLNIHFAGRHIGVSLIRYFGLALTKALATVVMMAVVALAHTTIAPRVDLVPMLILCVFIGMCTYFGTLALLRDKELAALMRPGWQILNRAASA